MKQLEKEQAEEKRRMMAIEREEEDKNLFDSVTITEINNNNLFYENEDDQEANNDEELPKYLEGRVWLDEDYMIRYEDGLSRRRYNYEDSLKEHEMMKMIHMKEKNSMSVT